MSKTILVIGGTGFTGGYAVSLLVQRGFRVRCSVRRGSDVRSLKYSGVELVHGDLDAPASLAGAFQGVDGIISTIGLHTGYAAPLVEMAAAGGIRRAVFVGSTSIFTGPDTRAGFFLRAAEEIIGGSGLDYTIIRPTMIYGAEQDRNISRLIRFLMRWPVLFIPGPGTFLVQPVFVEDAAEAIVDAFQSPRTIGKSYNIAGREPLTFNALVDTVSLILRKKVLKLHLPACPLIACLKKTEAAGLRFFLRADQLERFNENKAFAYDEAVRDFQYSSVSFATGVRRQIEAMGLAGSR